MTLQEILYTLQQAKAQFAVFRYSHIGVPVEHSREIERDISNAIANIIHVLNLMPLEVQE